MVPQFSISYQFPLDIKWNITTYDVAIDSEELCKPKLIHFNLNTPDFGIVFRTKFPI